ncbi:MAG TPA: helix-turn-helix transcriptional regulator [Candidatus Kapabacteria bacterium]|jgi:transcriptional regulator with XRE-family HTH domain|nr:helix-turn-helix transcriptional regulator [Candidatus Kapabacteria bacterium]HPP39599.1 helix-turn-helix transcriptional regulator [Candidatus Kapabacteria bacterium]
MENDYLKHIGRRLRIVRSIFNEGKKLSTEQFAHLLGETRDNIANYEHARASVPARVLIELYKRGINPTWVLTGDGDIFANNSQGKQRRKLLKERNIDISETKQMAAVEFDEQREVKVLKVAAGKIKNRGT